MSQAANLLGASPLYAITQPQGHDAADTTQLLSACRAALQGGIAVLQYRDKTAPQDLLRERAQQLAQLCAAADCPLIINDHLWLALELAEFGVGLHLGGDDADLREARQALPEAIIGASCYNNLARAKAAQANGASYVAFGAIYASTTKPEAPTAALATLTAARASLTIPIVAIGGIDLARAPAVLAAGAHQVAVISDLFAASASADAIECRARQYRALRD